MHTVLAHLNLDEAPVTTTPASAFFKKASWSSGIIVPVSELYIAELHRCRAESKTLAHHASDNRCLAVKLLVWVGQPKLQYSHHQVPLLCLLFPSDPGTVIVLAAERSGLFSTDAQQCFTAGLCVYWES